MKFLVLFVAVFLMTIMFLKGCEAEQERYAKQNIEWSKNGGY